MNKQPIGFIDSGVGGLTVVKEALHQLPAENTIYLGDQARLPYGPRPAEQVQAFTWQMVNFLLTKHIKMLVIACNTATAAALPLIMTWSRSAALNDKLNPNLPIDDLHLNGAGYRILVYTLRVFYVSRDE